MEYSVPRISALARCQSSLQPAANTQDADAQLAALIRAGLEKIAPKYQERSDRNLRLGELTEALFFALTSQPERFLAEPADPGIDQLLAE